MDKKILPSREFLDRMKTELGSDYEKYVRCFDFDAVRGIRINTKRTSREQFLQLFECKTHDLPFDENCLVLDSKEKLGNTTNHLSGLFYMQEPSSMIGVCASGVCGKVKVLDLCASPGGKTGQIVCKTDKDSIIISNEIVQSRAGNLFSNIERQGFDNVIVTNNSPEDFFEFENYFDYVFVDAPCSGEGMFRKNPETIKEWSQKAVESCAKRQRAIVCRAKDLVASGGFLVYSTCTFSRQEDEEIVEYLLSTNQFELVDVPSEIKQVTLPARFDNGEVSNGEFARKFYPFHAEGEGQFVAVLKKIDGEKTANSRKKKLKNIQNLSKNEKILLDKFISENFSCDLDGKIIKINGSIFLLPNSYDDEVLSKIDSLSIVCAGVKLGDFVGDRFEPFHMMFMCLGDKFKNKIELDDCEVKRYLHGEEIDCTRNNISGSGKIFAVVTKNNFALGGARLANGKLKNLLPKGLRI